MQNPVKKKIERGDVAYGVTVAWNCPDLVEFFGAGTEPEPGALRFALWWFR